MTFLSDQEKAELRSAAKELATTVFWNEADSEEIASIFGQVNRFRDAHLIPMRGVRASVISRMRHQKARGFTAARPKRLSSIRKKLSRQNLKIDQINDLAGCRAVVDDMAGMQNLVGNCRSEMPHQLIREYDYIENPKPSGYRCHHSIFKYVGSNDNEVLSGLRVELQIRTRLQHSWATAVEAVGLYRNEDMKAGEGNANWLELFCHMADELAEAEGSPARNSALPILARRQRICELSRLLKAFDVLESLRQVTQYLTEYVHHSARNRYFLIKFDGETKTASVERFSDAAVGVSKLHELERDIAISQNLDKVALVEVSKIDELVYAFPNYFGDVRLFMENLSRVTKGHDALEYNLLPQQVARQTQETAIDPKWLSRNRFHRSR